MFVADSGNNRILIIDEETLECTGVIGSGVRGEDDGSFSSCSFYHPQGLVLRENSRGEQELIICDVKNHKLRVANLDNQTVSTLAGTGERSNDLKGGSKLEKQGLASPWDIVHWKDEKYIVAMAGTHQIWQLDLAKNKCKVFSGSGREGNFDSESSLRSSTWAQPSGVSIGNGECYVADSESSTVRAIDLEGLSSSRNIIGGSSNEDDLFAFGDRDGKGTSAKLQHALGVHFLKETGEVLVADTYNHKLKVVDPSSRKVKTITGTTYGLEDGISSALNEPTGFASKYSNGSYTVYFADSNNNCIRTVDLETGEVRTPLFNNVPKVEEEQTTTEMIQCEGDVCKFVPRKKE